MGNVLGRDTNSPANGRAASAPHGFPTQRDSRYIYYLAFAIALITFLVYLKSLRNGFVDWDDNVYIVDNLSLRSFDASFVKWAFSSFYASNWHPLTWISHAVDYAVWGLNPLGHHLTNVILHAINTFVVVMLVRRLIEAWRERRTAGETAQFLTGNGILAAAGITGFLFGLHPLHVESVAWIAERKDLLCALFFLLSLLSYIRYASVGNAAIAEGRLAARFLSSSYLFALGFFMLALLSKPMAVSLPGVLLILDSYPFNRIRSMKSLFPLVVEKVPFIALSLVSCLLTIQAQSAGEAIQSLERVSASSRLLVAANALLAYLGKMAVPVNLVPFYPYPHDVSLLSFKYLATIIFVVLFTVACAVMARKQNALPAVWGYYLLTLLPVIGVVRVGSQAMADRYTYLPSIGPFLIVGLAVSWLFWKAQFLKQGARVARIALCTMLFVAAAGMALLTFRQIGIWNDSLSLWNYTISKEPGVDFAHNNRGWVLASMGRYDEALDDMNRAIALNPNYFQAYNNRGIVHLNMGHFQEAIDDFNRTIALKPSCYEAYAARGIAFRKLGLLDRAIESFDGAIALYPERAPAYNDRGLTYALAKQFQNALQDYGRAIALSPNFARTYRNRGDLYFALGEKDRAVADYRTACALGDRNSCIALGNMN